MSSSITIHSISKYFDALYLYLNNYTNNLPIYYIISDKLSTGHQFTVHPMAHSILDLRHYFMFKIMIT